MPLSPTSAAAPAAPRRLVVMGVAGCGKSAVGRRLAAALGCALVEGDDHHLPGSVEKMRQGLPLDDADRAPWLARLGQLMADSATDVVVSCSALKRRYRDQLRAAVPDLRFVYLEIDVHTAAQRAQSRAGHFFPTQLVASQFAALESPSGEAGVLTVSARHLLDEQVRRVSDWLRSPVADQPLVRETTASIPAVRAGARSGRPRSTGR